MRRAFKVATVFTGAAAAAAAFTPAVGAATAAGAQRMGPAESIRDCKAKTTTTSVVLVWPKFTNHGDTCVGDAHDPGDAAFLNSNGFSSYCPGNNVGNILTRFRDFTFKQGTTFHRFLGSGLSSDVKSVSIASFNGDDKCKTQSFL